jgi:hypothetical protein
MYYWSLNAQAGASFSAACHALHPAGQDVAQLVAEQAAAVYLCAREWKTQQQLDARRPSLAPNVERRGMITQLTAAGTRSTSSC